MVVALGGNAIAGERWQQTLPMILATPAPRLPLFVEEGEWIRVDTRTGEYMTRAT